jgi:integrase
MLTPSAVSNAKPRQKPYKLTDGKGLYLHVAPTGARWWRWRYRRPGTGKENLLSLGTYPEVSLKKARDRRDDARTLLADGIDPSDRRKAEALAAAETFEAVAREWYARHSPRWAPTHADKVIGRLERDVFPWIGGKSIAGLTAPDVLSVLRRIEGRGAVESAHRARQHCGQVFRYAVSTGRANADVTRDLRGALTPSQPNIYPTITDPAKVGELLRAIYGFTGTFPVACALKLAALLFVRPGELRQAEWFEFNLEAAEWNIPAHKMKMREPHLVPLSSQAVAILEELRPLSTGQYLFPGARNPKRPISDMTLNAALRRLGYDQKTMTTHGFRAMARTMLDEVLHFRPDYIEHQLAHAVKDPNGRSYNRTAHLPERRKMMQAWADYLDGLRRGTNVVPLKRNA